MRAQDPLGDAGMGRDVVAGRQDREPGGMNIWHLGDERGGDRRLGAVLGQGIAETIEEEGLPIVLGRDPVLVRRDVLESGNMLTELQHLPDLGQDLLPPFLELLQEREIGRVDEGRVRHQALPPLITGDPTGELLAKALDALAHWPFQGLRLGRALALGRRGRALWVHFLRRRRLCRRCFRHGHQSLCYRAF